MSNKRKLLDKSPEHLTFDDVLLVPSYSDFTPHLANTKTKVTKNIELSIPLISSAMDTVTESQLAIAMAQNGGIGCIHKNMTHKEQVEEVRAVKKHESAIVTNPFTITPNKTISDVINIMSKEGISGVPVTESETSKKLLGIITNRDVRFATDKKELVKNLMTSKNLVTSKKNITKSEAKNLLHKHKIERIIIVDDNNNCIGLLTNRDLRKSKEFPHSCKDSQSRLRVAAAIGTDKDSIKRAESLIEAEVDILVVDTAHGHSQSVINIVQHLKKNYPKTDIIAGNIATKEAALALIKAGVDAVKVGIGPGSICTTRIIAGVGVPQLSAIMDVSEICEKHKIPLIADGGIKFSGDLAKAIAAGANTVMVGGILAGTDESPGEVTLYKGRSYKTYRGMGSIGAMNRGSADRYFQKDIQDKMKLVPEGVEGRVACKGPACDVIHQMIGGLKAAMGYTGNKTIKEMRKNCQFNKISNSSLRESHPHNIQITSETPNYTTN
ncbi:IMP dehydrogenase [Rickettsiales bacterium]|nr:IMP dehydrogenase [Rickettsiales bacterium]